MVASISYFLFVILLATTVITILPSFNILPIVQSQDDGGDGEDEGGDEGDDGGDEGDDGEGNTGITSFFGNGEDGIPQDTASHPNDAVSGRSSPDVFSDQSPTISDMRAFAPSNLAGDDPPPHSSSLSPAPLSPAPTSSAPSLALQQPDSEKDKTTMGPSQSGSAGFASATEEDKVVQENIPIQSQQPQFTHITKLIAEDLKKMPMEEIRTYPWNELGDKDVELVIKYLSYEPKFLGKILVNTPEDVISKFQNSISLKTFNEIIANMPPEQVQLIKDKLS